MSPTSLFLPRSVSRTSGAHVKPSAGHLHRDGSGSPKPVPARLLSSLKCVPPPPSSRAHSQPALTAWSCFDKSLPFRPYSPLVSKFRRFSLYFYSIFISLLLNQVKFLSSLPGLPPLTFCPSQEPPKEICSCQGNLSKHRSNHFTSFLKRSYSIYQLLRAEYGLPPAGQPQSFQGTAPPAYLHPSPPLSSGLPEVAVYYTTWGLRNAAVHIC